MATADSTWSAVCVLPGAFNEAEDAVTVNGVPLYALNIPFSCQPPAWRLPPLGQRLAFTERPYGNPESPKDGTWGIACSSRGAWAVSKQPATPAPIDRSARNGRTGRRIVSVLLNISARLAPECRLQLLSSPVPWHG